jgi:two-component system, OmpR family, phosphate regulon sensor histidine kinase PhoR
MLRDRPLDEIFTQPDLSRLYDQTALGQTSRGQVRFPSEMGTAGGERIFEAVCVPLQPRGPTPATTHPSISSAESATSRMPRATVVLYLGDVTDLARSMQVKADFVANASHELRTPIATLRMCVETLQSVKDDEPMRDRLLATMESQTLRLEEMIRDLLDLSKLESPEFHVNPGSVSLPAVCQALRSTFQAICQERRLTLRFDLAPSLQHAGASEVYSDATLLNLVLQNLIENSTKFAYEGTEIRIELSPWPKGSIPEEAGLRVIVSDRGIGVPLSHQARIFERYYQVDEARTGYRGVEAGALHRRRGSGLGLAIVKHAVKALGGTVEVSSVWKQGTTMTVELPPLPPTPPRPASNLAFIVTEGQPTSSVA